MTTADVVALLLAGEVDVGEVEIGALVLANGGAVEF